MKRLDHGSAIVIAYTYLLVATLGACGATSRSKSGSKGLPVTSAEVRGDHELEARLEVLDPSIRESPTGRVLCLELRNKSAKVEPILFAVEWFDRRGIRVAANRAFATTIVLQPGAVHRVEVAVPVPEAESWRWHAVHPDSVR